jgi:hypothetical protein
MGRERRRTCSNCGESFTPDARNAHHQRYCSQPLCRAASKRVSQAKWLSKEENRHYHQGPAAVARVPAWRQAHPDYSQRKTGAPVVAASPPVAASSVSLTASMPVPASAASGSAAPVTGHAPDAAPPPLQEHLGTPLQDVLGPPLQAVLTAQPPVLIGLIAHLWDRA